MLIVSEYIAFFSSISFSVYFFTSVETVTHGELDFEKGSSISFHILVKSLFLIYPFVNYLSLGFSSSINLLG